MADDVEPARTPAASRGRNLGIMRSATVLAGGTALGQLASAAATPLLTRIYPPAAFGKFSLYFSFVTLAATMAGLTYNLAIVSARDRHDAALLLWLAAAACLPLSALSAIIVLGLARTGLFGFAALPQWSAIAVFLGVALASAFSTTRYWCLREKQFGVVSRATATQSATRALTQIVAGWAIGGTLGALTLGDVVGRVSGVRRPITAALGALRLERRPDLQRLWQVAHRYRHYPFLYLPSTLLDNVAAWLPLPIILSLYGATEAGHYAVVGRVFALPLSIIGSSVADAFHSRAAEIVRSGGRATGLMRRTLMSLFSIAIAPGAVVYLTGPDLFAFLLGAEWYTAGALAAAMTPWVIAQFCISPISRLVLVYNRQALKLVYDVFALALNITAFFIAQRYSLGSLEFVRLLSGLNVIAYALYLTIITRLAAVGAR